MARLLLTDVWFMVSMLFLAAGVIGAAWCLAASRTPRLRRGGVGSRHARGVECRRVPPRMRLCQRRQAA